MGRHAEIPLIALFAGVHVGVACFAFVLGEGRRRNPGGGHHRAGLERQVALGKEFIDGNEDLQWQLL